MAKKHGLGRGLNALLVASRTAAEAGAQTSQVKETAAQKTQIKETAPETTQTKEAITETTSAAKPTQEKTGSPSTQLSGNLLEISLENLQPGQYQPRQHFDAEVLQQLADSICAQGLLQPLVVRKLDDLKLGNRTDNQTLDNQKLNTHPNRYEIIAGERRFRAAKLAGLETVPVIIKEVSDKAALSMALIENIQRENLNALEEALALERLVKEFKLTHIEIAEAVGKSRTAITNSLRLLSLGEDVKTLLERGEIEVGHAKVLLGLRGQEQSDIARLVVARKLSVRETERLVAKQSEKIDNHFPKRLENLDPDVRRLQENLSEKLGARLEIQQSPGGNGKGKGKVVIHYNSLEELEGILEHIQ